MLMHELLKLNPAAAEAQPANKTVAEEYEETAEFDNDVMKVVEYIEKAQKIMKSSNWKEHIAVTQQNFDVPGMEDKLDKLKQSLADARKAVNAFYDILQKA